jgi:hypothetical protein
MRNDRIHIRHVPVRGAGFGGLAVTETKWRRQAMKSCLVYMAHRPGYTRILFRRRGEYPPERKPPVIVRLVNALGFMRS